MDWKFCAVLVKSQPLAGIGKKPVIPQETCCFIPVDSVEEGEYLVAVLNSRVIRAMMQACALPGSRGFASPRILQTLAIPHYDDQSTIHRQLAEIGRKIVSETDSCDPSLAKENPPETGLMGMRLTKDESRTWDDCMARLYGLSLEEYQKLCREEDAGA